MQHAALHLDTHFQIDQVDPRIFGGFLEHLGRCIYGGVYEPQHPQSNANGFREDVLQALRELEITIVRYPGGNFVSGYHWEDGVGPRDQRPVVRELAWQSLESNHFGTNELMALCQQLNWQPMLAVNLGTGTPEEAGNWVEYCNSKPGSKFADMRRLYGSTEPFNVPLWCLGNEMDGSWQLGHTSVDGYCDRARMAGKIMRDCDRSIELVACGSSGPQMPTFLDWDRNVMSQLGPSLAHYISLHRYVGNPNSNTADYLAVSRSIDEQIESVDAAARFVARQRQSRTRTYLCFDEWNVWYRARSGKHVDGAGRFAPPLLEEVYNLEDALVVAQFLMSFIRHADVVKVANLAQLVNVIAPILVSDSGILKQTIYHAFRMISTRKQGTALRQAIASEEYESESYGTVRYLDSAVTLDGNRLHAFVLNRDLKNEMTVTIQCADRLFSGIEDCELLHHPDVHASNSTDRPNEVASVSFDSIELNGNMAVVTLPPHSFAALTFTLDA